MQIFSPIYNKMMTWAAHRHAQYYLGALSFMESSFFPIPPDVMLAPMALAKPKRAWWYAFLTTITSVLGGIFGYLIGMFFLLLVHPLIIKFGYADLFQQVETWFNVWGFWIIFVAGFSPLPYKVFTIAAGAMHINLLLFIVASFISRGARFFLVAALMRWGGEPMERLLRRYVDRIGWATVILIVVGCVIYSYH